MPSLPSPGKVIRFDLLQTLGGDAAARDRIFFSYTGTVSVADLTTLATTVGTAWGTNISQFQTLVCNLVNVQATDLNTSTGAQVIVAAGKLGTNTNQGMAGGAAVVVKFKIARRYRGGHPRFYLGGAPATNLTTEQTWSAAFTSGLSTSFAAFVTAIQTSPPAAIGTLAHVNVSYFQGFSVITNPATRRARNVPTLRGTPVVDPVLGYTVNPRPASQRRRNLQSP